MHPTSHDIAELNSRCEDAPAGFLRVAGSPGGDGKIAVQAELAPTWGGAA